ncbi:hypothetical protein C2W64_01673 [Brevibacillus laterosporus]|nr:hypothetical protein C2W64_01673 [Brevibacillus laterosporus]
MNGVFLCREGSIKKNNGIVKSLHVIGIRIYGIGQNCI